MGEMYINRYRPVVTGSPQLGQAPQQNGPSGTAQENGESFKEVLRQRLGQTSGLNFSRHAVTRAAQRGVELSQSHMERLSEGVRIAGEKGLDDTLILIDKTAFLVSVKNHTVITTVNGDELRGNVFTNIDGTVII